MACAEAWWQVRAVHLRKCKQDGLAREPTREVEVGGAGGREGGGSL